MLSCLALKHKGHVEERSNDWGFRGQVCGIDTADISYLHVTLLLLLMKAAESITYWNDPRFLICCNNMAGWAWHRVTKGPFFYIPSFMLAKRSFSWWSTSGPKAKLFTKITLLDKQGTGEKGEEEEKDLELKLCWCFSSCSDVCKYTVVSSSVHKR